MAEAWLEDFGADPTGLSDISAAYYAALASLPPEGGTITAGEGSFRIAEPLINNRPNITHRFTKASQFLRDHANQLMFISGTSAVPINQRVMRPTYTGIRINGMGINDTSDDYPAIWARYTDGATIYDICGDDASSLVRVGRGNSGWDLVYQQCTDTTIYDVRGQNLQFFGIELHGHRGTKVWGWDFEGGSRSTGSTCAAVRTVKGEDARVWGGRSKGMGKGILATGDVGDEQQDVTFEDIDIITPSYGYSVDISGPTRRLKLKNVKARGNGPAQPAVARLNLMDAIEPEVSDCRFEATTDDCEDCLRIDGARYDAIIRNNVMQNRFTSGIANRRYGIRLNQCGGRVFQSGNLIDLAWNSYSARAMYNVSPYAGALVISKGDTVLRGSSAIAHGGYNRVVELSDEVRY